MEAAPYTAIDSLLLLGPQTTFEKDKILALDLDGTVITFKKKPMGENDYEWRYPRVPEIIKELSQTHDVVILTNQYGIGLGRVKADDFIARINNMLRRLPGVRVVAATGNDIYRKPHTGMYDFIMENYVYIDPVSVLYVGDAAGRSTDFDSCDIKFASNCGIEFTTPEVFFGGIAPDNDLPRAFTGFDPVRYLRNIPQGLHERLPRPSAECELVILVGPPASGKTTLARNIFPEYHYVNQDTISKGRPGKRQQCWASAEAALPLRSVIADCTNPDRPTRAGYIKAAKDAGVRVRCLLMEASTELCLHLNRCRYLTTGRNIPTIAISRYAKKYEHPILKEGFDEIIVVPFIPDFPNEEFRRLFLQWH